MLSKSIQALCTHPLLNQVCPDHFRFGQELIGRFDQHVVDYGLMYGTKSEREYRLSIFAENDDKIEQINSSQNSFNVGHNQFSTYTEGEFQKILSGSPSSNGQIDATYDSDVTSALPDSVDWRTHGAIGPVHNSGQQTILYAEFDAINSAANIQAGKQVQLSLQQLIDCAGEQHFIGTVYKYAKDYGFENASDYSSNFSLSTCNYNADLVSAKIDKIVNVNGTVDAIKTAIVKQPVSVAVEADKFAFQAYQGGILDTEECGTSVNHEMLVIGYGKYDGGDYFILKNSWGASWGAQGYIKIKASEGKGICGMNTQVIRPQLIKNDCFEWNNQMWIGNAPNEPVYTVCGLEECTKCPKEELNRKQQMANSTQSNCFEWNNKKWIGTAPEHPVYTVCGLDNCIECSQNDKE